MKWELNTDTEKSGNADGVYTARDGKWLLLVWVLARGDDSCWYALLRCDGIAGAWEVEQTFDTSTQAKRAAVDTLKKLRKELAS